MAGAATDAVWIDVLPSMRGFGPALSQGVRRDAESVGADTGKRFGTSLLAGVAVVAGGAALATKALYGIGTTFNDLRTSISTNTGMVGADLDGMVENVSRLGRTVPRTLEDIGAAAVAVQQSFGGFGDMTQEEFDRATTNALAFSQAFEIDMGRTTQVVGQLLKSGLVKDSDEAFDLLTAASQRVPVSLREDLLDAADEYGPFFAQLGISGEAAFDALVRASDKGMYGIDKTGDALKEFTIRATDMSTASAVGFDLLGMSQEEMANKLLAGGETASGAFNEILNGILSIQDPAQQSQAALALFGTPLEDLGTGEIPQFIAGLLGTSGAMDDAAGSADRMAETLNSGPAAQFQLLKNRLTDVLAPAAATVFNGLTTGLNGVIEAVGWFTSAWKDNDDTVTASGLQGFFENLGNVGRTLFDNLQVAADNVLPALATAFTTVRDIVQGTIQFFNDHSTAATALGIAVGAAAVLVGAAWVAQATVATINAAKSVAAWFTTATASTTSATIQSRSTAQIVVGWAAAALGATVNAAKIVAAWVVSTAQTGYLMALYAAQSVTAAASSAAAWVMAQIRTVASLAVTAAGFVVQGATMVASMAVTAASVVASWVVMGVQSLIQGARMAAAWVLAMGPVGWVITAIVGLVALIIANWDTVVSWTTTAWNAVTGFIKTAASAIRDWVVDRFNNLRDGVISIFTAIRDVVMGIWNGFQTAVVNVANALWTGVTTIFNGFRNGVVLVFTGIRDTAVGIWNGFQTAVVNVAQGLWDGVVRVFNGLRDGVVSIFTGIRDTVRNVWNGIVDAVQAPIRVVFTWVNDNMINPINSLLGIFPGNLRIPRISGFQKGGYTGDGPADRAAGIVHAGEYVFTQEQVKRIGLPRIEAIANGAPVQRGELAGVSRSTDIGGPSDVLSGIWNATGGRVVSAVSDAVSWAADMVSRGARAVAESVIRPLANSAKNLTPNGMIGNVLDGVIDKMVNAVLGKSDEQDRVQEQANSGGGAGGGGPMGDGTLGRGWQSLFNTIKAIIPQARVNSSVRNTPDAHGRGKAVDFGFGTGPGGAGSAGLALIKRTLYDRFGSSLYELIYNGVGNDRPNLKNSRPLAYSAGIQAQHRNHVHAAVYDQGGLWEPGTAGFNFTGGVERVLTPPQDQYFRKFVDLTERQGQAGFASAPVHLYTPDIPHAIRALRDEEQQREALAPAW